MNQALQSVTEIVPSVMELKPDGFHDPQYLVALGGVAFVGFVIDYSKSIIERQNVNKAYALPDEVLGKTIGGELKVSANREKAAHWLSVGIAASGCLYLSQPYVESTESLGSATIVLDAGYRADVTDMDGGKSRLESGLLGSLKAAENKSVPVSFILVGSTPTLIDRLPSDNKDTDATLKKIDDILDRNSPKFQPNLRNGANIAEGIKQAEGLNGDDVNKVITITANLTDAKNINEIKELENQYKNNFAVVTGKGNGQYNVGSTTLTSGIDVAGFQKLLGNDKVAVAKSTEEVTKQVEKILDESLIRNSEKSSDVGIKSGILFAVSLAALGIYRRANGINHNRKSIKKSEEK